MSCALYFILALLALSLEGCLFLWSFIVTVYLGKPLPTILCIALHFFKANGETLQYKLNFSMLSLGVCEIGSKRYAQDHKYFGRKIFLYIKRRQKITLKK